MHKLLTLVAFGALVLVGLGGCGDEEANACPDPEANEPYCCSEAGIPLYPECSDGELVCPEGTRDCALLE